MKGICIQEDITSYHWVENNIKYVKDVFLACKIFSPCLVCKQREVKPIVPLMADLWTEILSIKQQFTYTGVDYFCLIYVKFLTKTSSNQAIAKTLGVIFVCLTVQAIYIELASDWATDIFLLTLRRFIKR